MSNRTIPETARVLIKAKAKIADRKNWCQRALEIDGRYCAMGALCSIAKPEEKSEAFIKLQEAAENVLGRRSAIAIPSVNNELGHAAVMQMFDLAISRALQQGESDG